ncbi:hypothetical protein ABQF35_07495 [Mycobacterium syngnathidarum]
MPVQERYELMVSDEAINGKWGEFATAVERLAERIGDEGEFRVEPGSSLAGDDRASHPFEVSQAIRHMVNATVDQLHGVKVAVHDARQQHLAVSSTLARSALENTATALWVLGPSRRDDRVERVLRWHSRNYHDLENFLRNSERDTADVGTRTSAALEKIRAVADGRGIDSATATSGYAVTTPIKGAADFTDLAVFTDWQIASGFAHARPWAHHGFLQREEVRTLESGHSVFRMTARDDMTIYLPLQALHLLGQLLRLRDRRAGLPMPPHSDGFPDGERPTS